MAISKRRLGETTLPAVGVGFDLHAQRAQDAFDFGIGDLDAQHAGDAGATQHDAGRLRQMFRQYRFHHRAGRTAGEFHDQPRGHFDGLARQFRIHAAFEAVRLHRYAGRACGRGR